MMDQQQFRVVERPLGWTVTSGGERVSPVFVRRETAEAFAARLSTTRAPQDRPCLKCDRVFASEGIHDRLCPICSRGEAVAWGERAPGLPAMRKAAHSSGRAGLR
ncbi:hypothetical protein [Frigidibacter oleivorans]|uniref:hypothetical protein n=1 Tax=Frigidibacter oleivorans TaxID=2487129 RepID=UPI000F8E0B56|nr:hypothetical protein [Frigidibacter oleivorans]